MSKQTVFVTLGVLAALGTIAVPVVGVTASLSEPERYAVSYSVDSDALDSGTWYDSEVTEGLPLAFPTITEGATIEATVWAGNAGTVPAVIQSASPTFTGSIAEAGCLKSVTASGMAETIQPGEVSPIVVTVETVSDWPAACSTATGQFGLSIHTEAVVR